MATITENSLTPVFAGGVRHKVEGKNRITIPSAWRFEVEVELFMIARSAKKCIGVYTKAELDRHKSVVTGQMTPENRARFLDAYGRLLHPVTLDKAGRISIPDELCRQFGIEREVYLSGSIDTFNIWNVADYEAEVENEKGTVADVMRQLGI